MPRIVQPVADIRDARQLIRYATAGQLEQVCGQESGTGTSQAQVALGAGFARTRADANSNLSTALRTGLTYEQLHKLDEVIGALAPDLDGTGGLCSLGLRLSEERRGAARSRSLIPRVPAAWIGTLLRDPPGGDAEILIQAATLLSAFGGASKVHHDGRSVTSIRQRYRAEIDLLVQRLILMGVSPPTSRNYDAQILLGMLASYTFDDQVIKGHLTSQLRDSPLGFRVWRAVTKLVTLDAEGAHAGRLKAWVSRLVGAAEDLRKSSLYPGRSLDLELAITVPAAWSPPGDDWAGQALLKRAKNPDATIRERGTAVLGLWQRALNINDKKNLRNTENELRELITQFREPDARPDAAAGLRWVAATLEQAIEQRVPASNKWPDVGETWLRNVEAAADSLDRSDSDLPEHLRPGAKNLFRHMILQNAGVYRRQAIETVVTSTWTEPIVEALRQLLRNESEESWLRIRALFALSFLQRPDLVGTDLTTACKQAYENLELGRDLGKEPPRTRITEMHAALFAVGDCFGVAGAEDLAISVRDELRPILTELVNAGEPRATILHRAVRAAAYMLTVTAQSGEDGRKDLSQELLEILCHHSDPVTAKLSRWALSFRFATDGTVRPLLAAAVKRDNGNPRGSGM